MLGVTGENTVPGACSTWCDFATDSVVALTELRQSYKQQLRILSTQQAACILHQQVSLVICGSKIAEFVVLKHNTSLIILSAHCHTGNQQIETIEAEVWESS